MRVVIGQVASGLDPARNRTLVAAIAQEAAELRPDLLVLPEAMMVDFGPPRRDLAPLAEPIDGPFAVALADAARASGSVVVAGMFERAGDAGGEDLRPYNTLLAIAPDGSLLASYRKLHLYDAYGLRESDRFRAGAEEPPVFSIGDLRIGLLTCYDLRFPEVARGLVDRGADVLVVPAAWVRGDDKVEHWRTLLAARAIENTAYVVGAAQGGEHYCGHSRVLDPSGVALGELVGDSPRLLAADLHTERVAAVRVVNPSLANRRYGRAELDTQQPVNDT